MKIKRIVSLLLAVVLILSLTACGFVGGKGSVYWLNFKPELDETLQQLAQRYTEETGVDVKIVTPEFGAYRQTLHQEMASDNPPTMFVVNDPNSAAEWADSAYDLAETDIVKDLTNSTYNMTDEEGMIIAVPYCLECFGIAVNPKLLEQVGYTVDDITDFDTLKGVAESIHENAYWLGFDAFCSPDLDAESSWRITGHLANLEYAYEERESGTWKECPATITGKYLPYFKNLYDLCVNNAVSEPKDLAAGGHKPIEEFTSGKAVFFLTGSWDYAKLSAAIPDVTMIPYYCGVKGEEKAGLSSGSENFWAVNAFCADDDRKATLEFMSWLITDADASAALSEQLGSLPYKKASKSENGFLDRQKYYINNGCYRMEWAMTFQPNVDEYRADLVTALTAYNADQSEQNWDKFKTAFVDGWAEQYVAANK